MFDVDVGIPMSSAGMVYKKYGREMIRKVLNVDNNNDNNNSLVDHIYNSFYHSFVKEVDGIDNGVRPFERKGEKGDKDTKDRVKENYYISTGVSMMVSRHNLQDVWSTNQDEAFQAAVRYVTLVMEIILNNIFDKTVQFEEDYKLVSEAFQNQPDPYIIVLDRYPINLVSAVLKYERENKCPEIKFMVYPAKDQWNCRTLSLGLKNRCLVKDKEELIKHVFDIVFVHNKRFIAATKTKEGAVKIAQLSI